MQAQTTHDERQQQTDSKLSMWFTKAKPAYEEVNGEQVPTFCDDKGELIEGIYFDLSNDVYHSLNAMSSSQVKNYLDSVTRYAYEYVYGISRRKTKQQEKTLDTGTLIHELVLEPLTFLKTRFREPVQSDLPDDALVTTKDIDAALIQHGLSATESKDDKIRRLQQAKASVDTSELKTVKDVNEALVKHGLSKSESKYEKAQRLLAEAPELRIFDVELEDARRQQGAPKDAVIEGREVTTWGGKLPVEGITWDDAVRSAQAVVHHPHAAEYLSEGFAEVTFIARCPVTGMMLKAKFDWLTIWDVATDLKSTRDTKASRFKRQIEDLRYDVQEQFYTYVASLLGVHLRRFIFVAVEYATAINCQPVVITNQKTIRKAREDMMRALQEIKERYASNNWQNNYDRPATLQI